MEPGSVDASRRLVTEEFPNLHKYSVVDSEPGVCRYCANPGEDDKGKSEETNQNATMPDAQNPAQTINVQTPEAQSLEEPLANLTVEVHSPEETINSQIAGQGQEHDELSPRSPASQPVIIQPGYTITSNEHQALFSGRVGSKGLTVAHIGPSKCIHHCSNGKQHIIGMMETVTKVDVPHTHNGQTTNVRTTSDLGLINLVPNCLVKNIICYKNGRFHGLKLYKGSIKRGTELRIIDRNGNEKQGKLTSANFNWKPDNQDSSLIKEVCNMLKIQNENSAISAEGDSGTLVTSTPKAGSTELVVYGIVTHVFSRGTETATIANRLPDILDTIDASAGLRDPINNNIDFTENES